MAEGMWLGLIEYVPDMDVTETPENTDQEPIKSPYRGPINRSCLFLTQT